MICNFYFGQAINTVKISALLPIKPKHRENDYKA